MCLFCEDMFSHVTHTQHTACIHYQRFTILIFSLFSPYKTYTSHLLFLWLLQKPQVSKYYFKKKTSSHSSRNGKDEANHDSRIQPRSPPSRQSLTFYDTPTYHAGEHGWAYMVQYCHIHPLFFRRHSPDTLCESIWFHQEPSMRSTMRSCPQNLQSIWNPYAW
jgi:hypothetical protein